MKTILVPLDGSAFGEHALPVAAALARRTGAKVELAHVHALDPGSFAAGEGLWMRLDAQTREAEQGYLKDTLDRFAAAAKVPASSRLIEGFVAESLSDHAEESGADLIVMTTHGRGALSRMWLGSVADRLVRKTTKPILFLRPTGETADLRSDRVFKKILVPLDGSDLAERILPDAANLARLFKAGIALLRAIPPLRTYALEYGPYATDLEKQLQVEDRLKAQAALEAAAARLRKEGVAAEISVQTGVPAETILDHAEKQAADLIAMSTHGRRGVPRLFLGSVADKVVRAAEIPVLVRRPAEE